MTDEVGIFFTCMRKIDFAELFRQLFSVVKLKIHKQKRDVREGIYISKPIIEFNAVKNDNWIS
ncbi:MAG: hypothetical protein JSW60_00135 [Thermoplasmatales archaeon]|nr:MAG: hypothetical protein JSW60_00135 [Thermoplasmatales archaeon]